MDEKTRKTMLKLTWPQLLCTFLLWLPAVTCVTLEGNVYQDVYVAFSPDVPESECEAIVASLQTVLTEASTLLYSASGNRVHFPDIVHVVLPSSYTGCGVHSPDSAPLGYSFNEAPLRVGLNHTLFGASIWTQQPRQCGQRGDFISFAPESVMNNTLAARQLVTEWAKYRWGIMEEVGHEDDHVYPPAYPTAGGGFSPTVCVDTPLTVSDSNCTSEQHCVYDAELNTNQTSSLLSVPELPNVTEMCKATTHHPEVPTKQNALCSGLSAFEVFQQHPDFQATPLGAAFPVPEVTATVSFENPVSSSLVIAVEYTAAMSEYYFEFDYVVDAVCEALRAYLQDGIAFGLLIFNDTATQIVGAEGLLKLNSTNRDSISWELENLFKTGNATATTRSLSSALRAAATLMPSGGSVVLLTRPLSSETEDVTVVASNAGLNTVWPLLYPYNKENISWFETLATMTGCDQVRTVATSLAQTTCLVVMREGLSQRMVEILSLNQGDQLQTMSSSNCLVGSNLQCTMSLTIDQSTTADMYLVSVYYSNRLRSITFSPSGLDCQELEYHDLDMSRTFACSSLPESISLEVVMLEPGQVIYSDVVAKMFFNSSMPGGLPDGEGIYMWTSDDLRDLQFTETSAPALFAQVYVGGRQVLDASVVASVTQLTSSATTETLTLSLSDTGAGADVTGNDGIYSSFISFSSGNVSDVDTLELSFEITASGPASFMPEEAVDPPISCCGSSLPLPSLASTPNFTLNVSARGRVTALPPANLPPGRVSDLRVATVSASVRLTFTAPGADQDSGTVSSYIVTTIPSGGGVLMNYSFTSGIVPAGSTQVLDLSADDVGCGELLNYVVSARDEFDALSEPSNIVKHEIVCITETPLSAGAIVGIVIGVLILFLLILLILYLACNWERRDELALWQCLTCNRSSQSKTKPKKNTTSVVKPQPRPTNVQMIKSIDDLYTKSDKTVKSTKDGVSNPGFDETPSNKSSTDQKVESNHQRKGSLTSYGSRTLEKYNMPYDLRDSTLQTTLPINRVGIPVLEQTNSYDSTNNPYVPSARTSPSPSQLPIYPNYNSDTGLYDMKPKHTESLPEYSSYNRSSPYSDQRPESVSSLSTTKSKLNTLV